MKNSEIRKEKNPDPWPTALRILTRRDYSRAELRKRLSDKGFSDDSIEETLTRCRELGYLDDARYARGRAASLMRQGRAVGNRILLDLKQRGINEEIAHQALGEARKEYSEDQLLEDLLEKKFTDFNYDSAPAKERRRVVHFLQRRGFAISRIMDQLTRKGSEASDEDR